MKDINRTAHAPKDWHPEVIKAAIRQTGVTLVELSMRNGLHSSAIGQVLQKPWPRVQTIVAAYLGLTPQEIWPSRYDEFGRPHDGRTGRKNHSRRRRGTHSQKREAA